jgi:hypothetical protein
MGDVLEAAMASKQSLPGLEVVSVEVFMTGSLDAFVACLESCWRYPEGRVSAAIWAAKKTEGTLIKHSYAMCPRGFLYRLFTD